MTQQYVGTKIVTAWPAENGGVPGYGVKYADGYQSWSPKETFEAAYLPIGNVGHLPPHLQRVVAEKTELDDKLTKLKAFQLSDRYTALPGDEQNRLGAQVVLMEQYSKVLGARLAAAQPG